MKIFLSWSGTRSEAAAKAFRDWLPFLINAADPWMSSADIGAGARWGPAIQHQLETAKFGLIFVTRSNMSAPWLLFESGAIARTVENTYVCSILIGLKPTDLPGGPLAQFQAKTIDRDAIWQVVQTINQAMEEQSLSASQLQEAFEHWWPKLEEKLGVLPPDEGEIGSHRTPEEMIEETLTIVRTLQRGQHDIALGIGLSGRANEPLERSIFDLDLPPEVASALRRMDAAARVMGHSLVPATPETESDTESDGQQ